MTSDKRLFVLDTNVLLHDPTAIFRFAEHDVFIPMVVVEELDAAKRGTSELARSARQVSRFLEDVIADSDHESIVAGLPLPHIGHGAQDYAPSGRLFLQTAAIDASTLPMGLPGSAPDNTILAAAIDQTRRPGATDVILVSKDINLRIKARIAGVSTEDYYNDKTLDDVDLLFTGSHELSTQAVEQLLLSGDGADGYSVAAGALGDFYPNEGLYSADGSLELIARAPENGYQRIERLRDYRDPARPVWGVTVRNAEQNLAVNLLMDPAVEFVTLIGVAGTGKTLLALAAGLAQCMDAKIYREIIMTRETISLGEDIGYLPGTEEEKMTPWMGALLDNLEVLADTGDGGSWGRAATADVIQSRIKIRSLSFMRGRTFQNRYIIIDEAQNLTAKQMRTLITRAGPGTKIVCLGNIGQIDTPYLSETTSGLTYVVDRFRPWAHSGHVTLRRGERSRLADYATNNL